MRWVVLVLAGCGQAPAQPKPLTPIERDAPARPAQIELQSSAGFDRGLDVAFDNAPPSFAYVRGDDIVVFDHDRSPIDGPRRSAYVHYRLGRAKAIERLSLIDDELWRSWVEPPPAATLAKLHQRAGAVRAQIEHMQPMQKLSDWTSMVRLQIRHTLLDAKLVDGGLDIELKRESDQPIASEQIKSFVSKQQHQEDEAWLPCTYTPSELAVYSNGEQVLVVVRYRYAIDCDDRDHAVRLWSIR